MGVENYTIGKGLMSIDGVFVGNAPEIVFKISVETRVRYKAATTSCTKYVSDVQVVGKTGKLMFQLDEFSSSVLDLAANGKLGAQVVVAQTNAVGPQRTFTFNTVNIWPSGFPLISSEFAYIDFEADVLFDSSLNWGSIA